MEKYSSSYSTKRKTPFKRAFSRFKRRRIGIKPNLNSFSGQYVNIKCEVYDTVYSTNGVSTLLWQDTAQTYYNLATLLGASTSFQNTYINFAMYKITGLSLTTYVTSDPSTLRSAFTRAAPALAFALFPQNTSSNFGNAPKNQENHMFVASASPDRVHKYWSFPNGYGSGMINALGVWNRTNDYSSLAGQVSVTNVEDANLANSTHNVIGIRFTIYVTYKSRNQ